MSENGKLSIYCFAIRVLRFVGARRTALKIANTRALPILGRMLVVDLPRALEDVIDASDAFAAAMKGREA